ncbi:hypothetical protein WIS52_19220 [Pseudonocardia nematodicida]|uniref:C2H2-type domain-containing protein n=1 Tax=Pseudonocardia nematodicida TaxID=1206997 RepID=A0ABV1KE57_9PSEU
MTHPHSQPAIHRIFCTRGVLAVMVCPLCAALVLTEGLTQHARVHAAEFDRRPTPITTPDLADPKPPERCDDGEDRTHQNTACAAGTE